MEESFLSLIEESIKTKNNEIIEKLSLKINMNISQTKLFIKYFHKFNILSSILDTKYVNYFNKVFLTELKEKDELTNENFIKTILIFIKEKRKNKHWYYLSLKTENDIKLHTLILSQLDNSKSLKYDVDYNGFLKLINHLNLFNYLPYIHNNYVFESLAKELIEKQIDAPFINAINIEEVLFDKVLNYSRRYPNRIKYLDFYSYDLKFDKLKELIELNKESLICYPHCNADYLIPLKNAFMLNGFGLKKELNNNYLLKNIKIIDRVNIGKNEEKLFINLLNRCPNVEEISFYKIDSEIFFNILVNINCPKIKILTGHIENLQNDFDWGKIFENLPLLEDLTLRGGNSFTWTYSIYPIFIAEKNRLDFPLLEQLMRNYLKGGEDRELKLDFGDEFEEFWDYFKDKKDITSRISEIIGSNIDKPLDSYFKFTIDKYSKDTLKKIDNIKYYYCYVEIRFNKDILDFIKRNKIEYLFILGESQVDLNEFEKCDELKFVYDNTSKIFLYRNKENNILEKL